MVAKAEERGVEKQTEVEAPALLTEDELNAVVGGLSGWVKTKKLNSDG